jgi:hypothetical protein
MVFRMVEVLRIPRFLIDQKPDIECSSPVVSHHPHLTRAWYFEFVNEQKKILEGKKSTALYLKSEVGCRPSASEQIICLETRTHYLSGR